MARPKKQLNRRADILAAAKRLFEEKGFEKTTIDEIAKYIGIGKGTVYLDFKNKQDILAALIEQQILVKQQCLESLLETAEPPYLNLLSDALKHDVGSVFDMATSQVHTNIALFNTSYYLREKLSPLIFKSRSILARLFEKAEKNGEINPVADSSKLAELICITLQGFFPPYDIKYSFDRNEDMKLEEVREMLVADAATVIDLILSALKVPVKESATLKK